MQKFIFTLKRKCLRWSGPLSWTKRNSGGCHLLLLQISIKADTGCLPTEGKKPLIFTLCGNELGIQGGGWDKRKLKCVLTWQIFHCSREVSGPLLCSFSYCNKTFKIKSQCSLNKLQSIILNLYNDLRNVNHNQ